MIQVIFFIKKQARRILNKIKSIYLKIYLKLIDNMKLLFNLPLPTRMINANANTILVMTAKDYHDIGMWTLVRNKKKISSILALDDDAINIALSKNIPFNICEDFLDEKDLDHISKCINYFSSECLKNITELNKDGINYAFLDKEILYQMFTEMFFSKKTCCALIENGKNIIALIRQPYKIFEYTSGDDSFAKTALALNSPNIQILKAPIKCRWSIPRGEWDSNIDIADKVVVVNSLFEVDRHKDIIEALCKKFPQKVCVLCTGYYYGNFNSVPIYATPILESIDNEKNDFLKILNHPKSDFIFDETLFPYFKTILHYFCTYRWPQLSNTLHRFKELFNDQRPKCIIGTALADAESQIAIIAAKQLNIKTYAWQHALCQGIFSHYKADKIFIASKYAYQIAQKRNESNIIPVKDINLDNLYLQRKIHWNTIKKFKILILPAACRSVSNSYVYNNFKIVNQYVNEFLSISKILKKDIDIRFKAHPGSPCTSLYNDSKENLYFFPNDASLIELLDQTDCSILIGEIGCALIHSCIRVPTFFCETNFYPDETLREVMLKFPHRYNHIDKLWEEIEKLISGQTSKQEYIKRQEDWGKFDQTYPSFLDIIQHDLQI